MPVQHSQGGELAPKWCKRDPSVIPVACSIGRVQVVFSEVVFSMVVRAKRKHSCARGRRRAEMTYQSQQRDKTARCHFTQTKPGRRRPNATDYGKSCRSINYDQPAAAACECAVQLRPTGSRRSMHGIGQTNPQLPYDSTIAFLVHLLFLLHVYYISIAFIVQSYCISIAFILHF